MNHPEQTTVEDTINRTYLRAPFDMLDQAHTALDALSQLMSESDNPSTYGICELLKATLRDLSLAVECFRFEIYPNAGSYSNHQVFEDIREQFRARIYCEMEDRI